MKSEPFGPSYMRHVCKTNCKMFISAKVMVGQKVIQCAHEGRSRKRSVIQLISKINSQNLVIVAL